MKYKKIMVTLLAVLFLASAVFATTVKAPLPPPSFPNLPTSAVTLTIVRHDSVFGTENPPVTPPNNWYLDDVLSGVGAGFDVHDGTYTPSWCVDRAGHLFAGASVMLYSSLALPLEPLLQLQDWNRINYVLNHIPVGATTIDIQLAIWHFMPPDSPNNDPAPSATCQGMITAAMNNGGSFVPGPGQYVAVVCDPVGRATQTGDGMQQITIIVLQIPTTGPGLSPGFWKHNVGVYLKSVGLPGENGAYSDPVNSIVVTKATMGAWLHSHWTNGQLQALFAALSTTGGGATGAAIRVGAANVFNAAAGLAPYSG